MEMFHGAESHVLRTASVELYCTAVGGHMGPVRFRLGRRWVSPYSVSPWQPDACEAGTPMILRLLRGDFFCLPFGENPQTGIHGEPANGTWTLLETTADSLRLAMTLANPAGRIVKTLQTPAGETAVYQEHLIDGVDGFFNYGYHAILHFPEEAGVCHINTSPFKYGGTFPGLFASPALGERGLLAANAEFSSLAEVPLADGGTTSLNQFPARPGSEDLIMVTSADPDFAWTAVTLDGYVWLSLKNPQTLPSTLFWMSNGGRPQAPWCGRHARRIGFEEVNSYFCCGLAESREAPLRERGVPTGRAFAKDETCAIRSIHCVAEVPADFGMVVGIERVAADRLAVRGASGAVVDVAVQHTFLNLER